MDEKNEPEGDVVSSKRTNLLLAQMQADKINDIEDEKDDHNTHKIEGEQTPSSLGEGVDDKALNTETLKEIDETFDKLRVWKEKQSQLASIDLDSDDRIEDIKRNIELSKALISDRNDAIEEGITANNSKGAARDIALSKLKEFMSSNGSDHKGQASLADLSELLDQNRRLEQSREKESKQSDGNSAYQSRIQFGGGNSNNRDRGEGKDNQNHRIGSGIEGYNNNNNNTEDSNKEAKTKRTVFPKLEESNVNLTDDDTINMLQLQAEGDQKADQFMNDDYELAGGMGELESELLSFGDEIDALFDK